MSIIKQIERYIKGIESNYEKFDENGFNSGSAEYTPTAHKKLLKEVIELLKAVTVAPDLFIQEFTTDEMNKIVELAARLSGSPDHNRIFSHLNLDANRSLISRMRNVFGKKEALQYKSEVDKLQALMVKVEDMLKKEKHVSSIQGDIAGISAKLGSITKSQHQAQKELEDVHNTTAKVGRMLGNIDAASGDIEKRRSAIVKFFGEIALNQESMQKSQVENADFLQKTKESEEEYEKKREEHLQKLQAENADFLQKTKESEEEHKKNIGEVLTAARGMLDSANVAGLAGAFNQRIIKGEKKKGELWLAGAFVFIMGAIVIALLISGVKILGFSIIDKAFDNIWARISITTLPLLAAYFCAAQYLKLERTLEDYEYKKALAQSMPVFMEQLGKGSEECRAYLSLALQQMLQDPLRKKHDIPFLAKDLFDNAVEKLSKVKPENKTPKDTPPEKKDDKP